MQTLLPIIIWLFYILLCKYIENNRIIAFICENYI
nr:MAG TPA: hypothetical protein [Caudoviricetes sp.]DAW61066.1 MAG TPA: hypothetical protein [Caudoviricetes sp.]